ncbi:hypothetical protein M3685_12715 [Heyndrickxia oleronia]|uniref:hypothetical protein n=1 Tax=Heyndrickxia oleronia TaxID=38875 RepID=UPI00203BA8E5|nr:hypothetical protein [Heyndrickxia oleronia]MCM3454784.1 hypothetical protein [Heyndrickxia oleronia]
MTKLLKFSFAILAFMLFFAIKDSVNANAAELTNSNGVKMTEQQHQNLQNLGFTDLAIDQMTQEIFDQNKDLVVERQSEDTKYYEVKEVTENNPIAKFSTSEDPTSYISTELSKEEYFKRVEAAKKAKEQEINTIQPFSQSDTTTTSYRRLTTTIQLIGSDIRFYNKFIWDQIPATRSYDVLAATLDSYFTPLANTNYGQQLWSVVNPTTGASSGGNAVYSSSSSTWTKQSAGYGVRMNLKDNASNARVVDLQGYMYYKIAKNSSITPKYINAFGNYSHAKKTVGSSLSYGLDFGGPSISWQSESSTSFDTITTHAQVPW